MATRYGTISIPNTPLFFDILTSMRTLKQYIEQLKESFGLSGNLNDPVPYHIMLPGCDIAQLYREIQQPMAQFKAIVQSTPAVFPVAPELAQEQYEYKWYQSVGLYEIISFQRALAYHMEGRTWFALPSITSDLLRRWKFNWSTDGMRYRRIIARRIAYLSDKSKEKKEKKKNEGKEKNIHKPKRCLDVRAERYYIVRHDEGDMGAYMKWEEGVKRRIDPKHYWLFDNRITPDLEWTCLIFTAAQLMEKENQFRLRMERWQEDDRNSDGRLRKEAGKSERGKCLLELATFWGNNDLNKQVDKILLNGVQPAYEPIVGTVIEGLFATIEKAEYLERSLEYCDGDVKVSLESNIERCVKNGILRYRNWRMQDSALRKDTV